MATYNTYNLTITQTRPDTNVRWYDRETNAEWLDAWKAFNLYEVETTVYVFGEEPHTEIILRAKITGAQTEMISDDRLIKTRRYLHIPEDVYNEFIALLNDDESGLSGERRHNEGHGITYELVTEEEVHEIVPETP
jgi:hypothetical protein